MLPVFVDYTSVPPRAGNAGVREHGCHGARDHLALGAGGAVSVTFEVPPEGVAFELTLELRCLVSRLGDRPGHAPLYIALNGRRLVSGYRIAGGGDLPQRVRFAIPATLARPGANVLRLASARTARSMLWLYQVLLEQVYDRGDAERAMLADSVRASSLDCTTRLLASGDDRWVAGPPLRVYVDSGEGGLLAQLAWRAVDGTEASVVFNQELTELYGHLRDPAGRWHELRGDVVGRRAYPAGTDHDAVLRFETEANWGRRWHPGGPLTLFIDPETPVERVSWRDQRECSASIGMAADGSSFLGWSQRVGEGPVGYRGIRAK